MLRQLAKWGFGPIPSEEALAHEITVRRSKFLTQDVFYTIFLFVLALKTLFFFFFFFRNGNNER